MRRIRTMIVLAAMVCAVLAGSSTPVSGAGAAVSPAGRPFVGVYGKRW